MNDPNALFVFQIGSTLTTASNSRVNVINGGANNGIYWVVGSSATLGTGTAFAGNIVAYESITLTTGANILCGSALARNAAVTMDTNTVSGNCLEGGDYGTGRDDFGSRQLEGNIERLHSWLIGKAEPSELERRDICHKHRVEEAR